VSVVWAVGDADERHAVEQAQDSAASTLVDYMRRHCPLVRDHGSRSWPRTSSPSR
jgi:hypothetical protein